VEDLREDPRYGPAAPDDLTGIRELLARCQLPADDLRPSQLAHFVLCRDLHKLVGTVGLEPLGEVALLRSLAVAPEVRGRGIAHQLWARARERASALGIQRLYLLTTTAEGLFARWGFRRIARDEVAEAVRGTAEYSMLCPSTAVVMALRLSAGRLAAQIVPTPLPGAGNQH